VDSVKAVPVTRTVEVRARKLIARRPDVIDADDELIVLHLWRRGSDPHD